MKKLTPYLKNLLGRYPMTVETAARIVGREPMLGRLIEKLQADIWHNTSDDEKRLVAAFVVSRYRAQLKYNGKQWTRI